MARSTKSGAQPVALELLESDHRRAEALFEQYEDAKESEEQDKQALAEQICDELTIHAQVEEEIFYPWLRENLSEEDMELVEEALVEHATAKDLIGQIQDASADEESFDAKVKVLSEYVKHHVAEEENEIFDRLADFDEALDEVGQRMHARKAELRAELGLTGEDGEAAMPAAAMGRGAKQRGRGAPRPR